MFHFYTPRKHQKTSGFLMFSGGYRSGTLVENGLNNIEYLNHINTIVSIFFQISHIYYG